MLRYRIEVDVLSQGEPPRSVEARVRAAISSGAGLLCERTTTTHNTPVQIKETAEETWKGKED